MSLYLVKWCSLPYEDSTWELKVDIDAAKIEEFEQVLSREPQLKRVVRRASVWCLSLSLSDFILFISLWLSKREKRHVPVVQEKPLSVICVLLETGATSS